LSSIKNIDPSRGGYYNVCGEHNLEEAAKSDHLKKSEVRRVIGKAERRLNDGNESKSDHTISERRA
jgi:hypothetical protein